MSQPMTATELREAQRKEYGMYVALAPIDVHGTRAFNEGDSVPIGHVEQTAAGCPVCEALGVADQPHVSSDLVAKATTDADREAAPGSTEPLPRAGRAPASATTPTPTENPKG